MGWAFPPSRYGFPHIGTSCFRLQSSNLLSSLVRARREPGTGLRALCCWSSLSTWPPLCSPPIIGCKPRKCAVPWIANPSFDCEPRRLHGNSFSPHLSPHPSLPLPSPYGSDEYADKAFDVIETVSVIFFTVEYLVRLYAVAEGIPRSRASVAVLGMRGPTRVREAAGLLMSWEGGGVRTVAGDALELAGIGRGRSKRGVCLCH